MLIFILSLTPFVSKYQNTSKAMPTFRNIKDMHLMWKNEVCSTLKIVFRTNKHEDKKLRRRDAGKH